MSSKEITIPAQRTEAALELAQSGLALPMVRPPAQVLAEAQQASQALMDVINAKPKEEKLVMNGRLYLEFEDWNTVARFFGVTSRTRSTAPFEIGGAVGFECTAEAIRMSDGMVLGVADAMCLNDEDNWGARPVYKWEDVTDKDGKVVMTVKDGKNVPKRRRVETGTTVATPLFQLRSMAQTRAKAKVLRDLFSWVIVLAGNKGVRIALTPAEEITQSNIEGSGEGGDASTVKQPMPAKPTGTPISEGQAKRMYAITKEAGFSDADARIHEVIRSFGFEHRNEVTRNKYDEICKALQDKDWKPQPPPVAAAAEPAAKETPKAEPLPQFKVSGKVDNTKFDSDRTGKYFLLEAAGLQIYTRDALLAEKLEPSKGQYIEIFCRQLGKKEDMKAVVERVVRVGDHGWEEDGTLVMYQDERAAEPTEVTGKDLFGDKDDKKKK